LGLTEHRELLNTIRRELADAKEEHQFREATAAALIRLWHPVIKRRLNMAFDTLAPKVVEGSDTSNLAKEIQKQGQQKN
jgi:hypothetical protein